MSLEHLKKLYSHGAIIRIKLENFVTYDSLEFTPGANLNVVIGPNGTGKSTIVCAICLGMAGKPAVLGRAANLCDYIKYGRNRAIIEIELNNTSGRNYLIRRELFKDNKSDWYLNGGQVKIKEIEELVTDLNIQVSNLCQFLPQEKVTEFARMNSQQLLENTEKAVGGIQLFEQHCSLKEQREESKNLERDIKNLDEQLKKEIAINQRLEGQVKSFLEKRKYEEKILWLKRKHSWVTYNEKKLEFEHLKKEKEVLNKRLMDIDNKYGPLHEVKSELENKHRIQKDKQNKKADKIKELMKLMNSCNAQREELNEKIIDARHEYSNKEAEFKQRKAKINDLKMNIEICKNELGSLDMDKNTIKSKKTEIDDRLARLRPERESLHGKEHDIRDKLSKLDSEKQELKQKIDNIQSVRQEKLRKLRQHYKDAYEAIEWLDANRNKFEGRVYEPMILLINLKNADAAKYVESLIPKKDLNALFLFENSNDMHYFITELRDRRGLVVHAAIVPRQTVDHYHAPIDINQLKKYGFRSYVREVIDAPDAVLRYLCMYCNIHRVPYGDEYTQKNLKAILPNIPELARFYTATHQYSISKSRYNHEITSQSSEVGNAFFLSTSVNQADVRQTQERLESIDLEMKELEDKLKQIRDEFNKTEKKIELVQIEEKQLNDQISKIKNLENKLASKQQMLEHSQKQNINLVDEAKKLAQQICEYSKKRVSIYDNYANLATSLMENNKEKIIIGYYLIGIQAKLRRIENDLRQYNVEKQELQREIEQHQNQLKLARDEAKALLLSACKMNEINTESELPDSYKKRFSEFPDRLEEIESQIQEIEAKAQCSYEVDKNIVDDFNERKKKIEDLQKDYDKKMSKLNNHKNNYETMKNQWLDEIDLMLSTINGKFSKLFQILKCQGEVSLARPDNPEDYDCYGISIKVSFRSGEPMQELTAWQQSGGEKSVSTMLYMIALQEMTKCPFRVVDEINQGMDPVNERKVFDIIVQNSSLKSSAQYFLLTPKLLPDLAFDDKTKVICVFNGPHNLPHTQYNLRNFIETKRKLNSRD